LERLYSGGPGWQVLRVAGRQAGGGLYTLAGQNMDEWGWASVLNWMSYPLCFSAEHFATAPHQRTCSLGFSMGFTEFTELQSKPWALTL
jgi:hypothetical protein